MILAGILLPGLLLLAGCAAEVAGPGRAVERAWETPHWFVMPDGTALPYRVWMPRRQPDVVLLALHGMNDSRDAWEYPAPSFAAAGMAVFAPDQRGFGATPTRGIWPGTAGLVADDRTMIRLLRERYPHSKLIVLAESMGAAAAMVMASEPDPPPVDGYVLVAPAVWGRSEMNLPERALLWLADHTVPGLRITGGGFVHVRASDNRTALMRLSMDPLTLHATRVDAVKGLVDLMGRALASAGRFHGRALVLYGGHDQLVPPRAMAAAWRALLKGARPRHAVTLAFYPNGYHLLLRDQDRAVPIHDILAWIRDPDAPLPSAADKAARAWLARRKPP